MVIFPLSGRAIKPQKPIQLRQAGESETNLLNRGYQENRVVTVVVAAVVVVAVVVVAVVVVAVVVVVVV